MYRIQNKKKIGIPLHNSVFLNKSGVQGGIHYTDMFRGDLGSYYKLPFSSETFLIYTNGLCTERGVSVTT